VTKPIPNVKPLSPTDEKALIEFHNILIDEPQTLFNLAGEETYFKIKLIRLHESLSRVMPQYNNIDGVRNVWIVKPSYNARGLGIYCARNLS